MSISTLYSFKVLVFVPPYKHFQDFVYFQRGTSAKAFNGSTLTSISPYYNKFTIIITPLSLASLVIRKNNQDGLIYLWRNEERRVNKEQRKSVKKLIEELYIYMQLWFSK